jgi:hypothetical protein
MVAHDLRAIGLNDFTGLVSRTVEVRKMLRGLMKKVNSELAGARYEKTNCEKSQVGGARR